MARPKRELDADLEKEMDRTAKEWKRFREANKLSQKFLSEIIGISRRTIQSIESGQIIPQQRTVDAFKTLQTRYDNEGKPTGRRKTKKNHHDGGEF